MRLLGLVSLVSLLALSACGGALTSPGGVFGPPPVNHTLPATGQIMFTCSNGAQLAVDFQANGAQVAIVGGPSMVLPNQEGQSTYSNGRYSLARNGDTATWQAPGAAAVNCTGQ